MYVGIDIGGTNIRLAASATLDHARLVDKVAFRNYASYERNLRCLSKAISGFGPEIQGIGISIAAEVHHHGGSVISSTHLTHWHHKPLVQELTQQFGCPVKMVHDQACAALGEATYGNHRGDFFWIGYGTGFGGAIIRQRRRGDQSEPEVQVIQGAADYALFSNWEQDCGGKRLELEFGKTAARLSAAEWQIIMERFSRHLLLFIRSQQPAAIVFGGGIAIKQAVRLEQVFAALRRAHPELPPINLTLASLGEDAALYGALALLATSAG